MFAPVPSSSDAVNEIRNAETKRQRRRQIIVGGGSSILLLMIVAAVATIHSSSDNKVAVAPIESINTNSKSIQTICSSTDYENTCRQSLSKIVKRDDPDTKELLKTSVSVIFDAIGAGFNNTQQIKTTDSQIKGAIEDCRELFIDSKDELQSALDVIIDQGIDRLPDQAHDIRTWLSAVLSFQQTCVDGFPDGEMKTKLNHGMTMVKELTSNALVMIERSANFISMLDKEGLLGRRKLLGEQEEEEEEEEDEENGVGTNGMPAWVADEERRVLHEGSDMHLKPDVTVAKDGSGKFKTISEALAAMPKNRTGRYAVLNGLVMTHQNS